MMGWKQNTTVIEEDNKACVDASKSYFKVSEVSSHLKYF